MVSIKDSKSLYCCDPASIQASLDFAKNLKGTDLNNNIHFYWRVPKAFGRKQVLPIKSAIVHNKNNSDIFLWSNVDLSDNEFIKPLLPYIKLKVWKPFEELESSFLKDSLDFFKEHSIDDEKCWLGGDLFRLLCLYKYGGIYVDMDMVVLRDLSPLYPYNFLYQWGCAGTTREHPYMMMNGAIMGFNAGNANLKHILQTLALTYPIPNSFCWGKDLYGRTVDSATYVFPCTWFNTEWGPAIPLEGFKKSAQSSELYAGAFTWHWHNRWDDPIEEGSKFYILESIINEKFNNHGTLLS
jgi:hypothetical protein